MKKRRPYHSQFCNHHTHNGEADIGKTEAWERSTIINNNNYHQSHYLIMELARGYLNPNSSNWKSLPILTKDMNSEDDENEDPIDEEEEKEEDKRTEKKRKHSQETNTEGAKEYSNTTIDARKQSIERQPTNQTNKRKDPPQLNTAEVSQGLTTIMTQQLIVDKDQHEHKHIKQYITHIQKNLTNNSHSDNMNPKTHIKQGNKGGTKRSNITPTVNNIYEKKMKQGPTPDVLINKTHHQTTIDPTTTNPSMTKHKRAYLLKERKRRQIQRSRIKEQKKPTKPITGTTVAQKAKRKRSYITPYTNTIYEKKTKQGPTKPIMGTVEVQKTKSKTPDTQNKTIRYGIKHTKNPETCNKNSIQKEGPSANILNRNRSLRWSTTRSNSKNTDTQKKEHTSTLQLNNSASMKRLSGHKRKCIYMILTTEGLGNSRLLLNKNILLYGRTLLDVCFCIDTEPN